MCLSRIMIILAMWLVMSLWNMIQWYSSELINLLSFVLYNSNSKYCYSLDEDLAYDPFVKFIVTPWKKVSRLFVQLFLVLGTIVDRIYVLPVTPMNWPGHESDLGLSSCLIVFNIRCIHPLDIHLDSLSALLSFKARPVPQRGSMVLSTIIL